MTEHSFAAYPVDTVFFITQSVFVLESRFLVIGFICIGLTMLEHNSVFNLKLFILLVFA